MKQSLLFASLLLLFGCSAGSAAGPLTQWTLSRDGDKQSFEVTVPCTVAGALNEAGYFGENILEGDRYASLDKSIFDTPWTFVTRFAAQKGMKHVLRFNSLGYSADIVLNGKTLASADTTVGPFCVREFDITPIARGRNTLKVTVHKAPKQSLNHGWVDWNPHPLDETMGILGDVTLISTPDVQVQDVFVHPLVDPEDLSKATLRVVTTLVNRSDKAVSGQLSGQADDGIGFDQALSLAGGETRVVETLVPVDQPRIWWSSEMGRPEMYRLEVCFRKGECVSHAKPVRFGIRSITSEITPEGYRQFILNGRKVLIKSAGWTDDLLMQDAPGKLREQALMVKDMGLNSIRFENIWGKDDTIYDLCDSLGLLAIVGFSCQWEWEDYCGLPETRRNGCISGEPWESLAVRYFHDQIIRLRNHPAVIAWLTGSDRAPLPQLEEKYMAVYNALEYRPYVCSAKGVKSPVTGPSGMKMAGPYEYVGPDYWFIDTQCGGAYGFNTETNPGLNIPQKENVLRLLGGAPSWPLNPVWDYHCTASSSHMNNMAFQVNVMNGTYGEASSFEDYVKKAHALDYDATRSMFEAFRCHIGKATGIVQWMLNSAWPSFYWQLFDWYDVPTAGYYGVKNGCAPVQLIYNYGTREVVAVNDACPEARYQADIYWMNAAGRAVKNHSQSFVSTPRQPVVLEKVPKGSGFLSLTLKDASGAVVAHNFYCIPAGGGEYVWKEADWWGIPMTGYADLSFVTRLPEAEVEMTCTPVEEGTLVKVTNLSAVVAYQNILKAFDGNGNLLSGPVWEDNFFSLRPGEERSILCRCQGAAISLDGWNIKVK